MKFVIKGTRPQYYETLNWYAAEEKNAKICFLNVDGHLYELDRVSFEMIYGLYENNALNPLWTIVVADKHIYIWDL